MVANTNPQKREEIMFIRIAIVSFVVIIVGCASIMTGGSSQVNVSSHPRGAEIFIDDESVGRTPTTISIHEPGSTFRLRIQLEGFQPYETVLKRKVSGWIWGNLLLGGVPGLVIDWMTGGMYVVSPSYISKDLKQDERSESSSSSIYVSLVRGSRSEWQKVGTLSRK